MDFFKSNGAEFFRGNTGNIEMIKNDDLIEISQIEDLLPNLASLPNDHGRLSMELCWIRRSAS